MDFGPFGGKRPEGWREGKLGDVTRQIRRRLGVEFSTSEVPVLSAVYTGELQRSDEYFTKQVYSKDIGKYIYVDVGDFAYNPARVNIGSIGINDFDVGGCVSPVYVAFSVNEDYRNFFRFFFKSSRFREESKLRASGSVRQSMRYEDFSKIRLVYPAHEWAARFERVFNEMLLVIRQNRGENDKLATIRDVLLKKMLTE